MGDNRHGDLIARHLACVGCVEVDGVVPHSSTGWKHAHRVHTLAHLPRTGLSTAVQVFADGAHLTLETYVLAHELGDLFDGMQRCGVVASAEGAADDRQR
jgi:hypothetical protein